MFETSTALSISASSQIMKGDFPPNSKVIFFKLLMEHLYMINYPTSVEPVNAILSIFGCSTNIAPVSPNPGKTLTTPLGNPAS